MLGGGGDLVFRIMADKAQFDRAIGSSRAGLTSFAATGIKAIGGLTAAFTAFQALGAAEVQFLSEKKLEATLRATGNAAGFTANEIKKLASARQDLTNFGDEQTIDAAGILATFKEIRGEAFEKTLVLAQDMSAVMGQDLKPSIVQLGKALNDPIRGVSALAEVGVSFNEQQRDQIKALVESNDLLGAQKVIMTELESEFGGAAEGMASNLTQLKNMSVDFLEFIGGALMPVVGIVKDVASLTIVPLINFLKGDFGPTDTAQFKLLPSMKDMEREAIQVGSMSAALDKLRGSRERLASMESKLAHNREVTGGRYDVNPLELQFMDGGAGVSTQDRIDELLRQIQKLGPEVDPVDESIRSMVDALRELETLDPTKEITAGIAKLREELGAATGVNKLIEDYNRKAEALRRDDPFIMQVEELANQPGVDSKMIDELMSAEQGFRSAQEDKTLFAEAEKVRRELMTPFEMFGEETDRLDELFDRGYLGEDEFSKSLASARDDFEKSVRVDPDFETLQAAGPTDAILAGSQEANRLIAQALTGTDSSDRKIVKNLQEVNESNKQIALSSERVEALLRENRIRTREDA